MVAIFIGLADPQFADHAAVGKDVLHSRGLLTLSKSLLVASSHSGAPPQRSVFAVCAHEAHAPPNHNIMLGGAEVWQGKALSNMPVFRIRMAND
jgi:hypothetical protein